MTTPAQILRAYRRECSKAGSAARVSEASVVRQMAVAPVALPKKWRGSKGKATGKKT